MTERYAYCPDDVVIELFDLPPPVMIDEVEHVFTLADVRHADYAALCRPCGPDVAEGWRWNGATFEPAAASDETPFDLSALKSEAGSVINAVAGPTTQANLSAAMAIIGVKPVTSQTAADKAFVETFIAGHEWIQSVRGRIALLAENKGKTPDGESRWPEPSDAVRELASRF